MNNEENLINVDELEEIPEKIFEDDLEKESLGSSEEFQEDDSFKEEKGTKKEKLPPTDDLITDNLVESFALLSSMLDEAKSTKENIEKIHESILKLLDVVTQLRDVSEEISKINQIVKEINVLVKAISVNNSNIKDLIDVIYKITEKQKKLEQDVNAMKNELFFTNDEDSFQKRSKNGNNFLLILNLAISGGVLILLFFIKMKGGM